MEIKAWISIKRQSFSYTFHSFFDDRSDFLKGYWPLMIKNITLSSLSHFPIVWIGVERNLYSYRLVVYGIFLFSDEFDAFLARSNLTVVSHTNSVMGCDIQKVLVFTRKRFQLTNHKKKYFWPNYVCEIEMLIKRISIPPRKKRAYNLLTLFRWEKMYPANKNQIILMKI